MADKPWYIPEEAITDRSVNPIAAGGFGEVFKASYYGAPVAIKQLYRGYNQNELADFGREIGIWHRLSHPHILPLLGACDTATKPFMVSPFMPNGTLRNHFATAPTPRPLGEKIRLLYEVASGMAYLHGNNIVHGDLKSLNVLLDGSSNAVVTDFGMSRTKHTSASANRTRRDQPTGGTLEYIAPEMLDDERPTGSSKATDVYAFGVTLYEVFNDCKPIWVTIDGQPMRESVVERLVLRGVRPKQFDGIPDDIRALIERCWHQDPSQRPKFPEILAILRQSTELYPAQDGEYRPTIIAPRSSVSFESSQDCSSPRALFSGPSSSRTPPIASLLASEPVPVKNPADVQHLLNFHTTIDFDSDEDADDVFDLWFAIVDGNDSTGYQRAFASVYAKSKYQLQLALISSAIATSQSPLTIRMIADLFGIDIRVVRRCIKELGPVLDPGKLSHNKEGSSLAKAQKHKSIVTYLLGKESADEPFHVTPKFHMAFASQCLLSILSHEPVVNICEIYDFHDMIPNFNDLVRAKIPDSLRYSVVHWITHYVWCMTDTTLDRYTWKQYRPSGLVDTLSRFLSSHVFFWLECGSLIGVIPGLTNQVGMLENMVLNTPGQTFDQSTQELVKDIHKFVLEFADPISKSAPQVYNSGYAFTPKETAIYKTYASRLEDKIPFLVTIGLKKNWDCPVEQFGSIAAMITSPDGTWVATWTSDGVIKVWDATTGQLKHTLKGHTRDVNSVAISPDGKTIVVVETNLTIKHLDASTGEITRTFTDHNGDVRLSAISPDGKFVAIVKNGDYKRIKTWDSVSCSLKHTLEGHTNIVWSVAISLDGKSIVSGSEDKTIKVWDATTGQLKHTLEGHTNWVISVAISPDGKWIVSGSMDKTIKVWDATTGQVKHTLEGHTWYVTSVAISPDGKWIVSGSADKTIKVWDATTGQVKHTIEGHTDYVNSVAISPDGKWIVSGSGDNTIKVWDATTGQVKHTLEGHTHYVTSVAISPDGNSISSRNWNPGWKEPTTREEFVWVRQGSQWVRSFDQTPNFTPTTNRLATLTSPEWIQIDNIQWIRHGIHAIKLPLYLGPPSDPVVSHILPIYSNNPEVLIAFASYLSNSPDHERQARGANILSSPEVIAFHEEQAKLAEERRAVEAKRAEEALKKAEEEALKRAEARKAKEEARKAEEEARKAKEEARKAEEEARKAKEEARKAEEEAKRCVLQ